MAHDDVIEKLSVRQMIVGEDFRDRFDRIDEAVSILESIKFPANFLDNLKAELIKNHRLANDPGYRERRYCYLAFFGGNERASYLKVGISKNPDHRVYGLSTGNPLECLWVYVMCFPDVRSAGKVERTILDHSAAHRARGEWVNVGSLDKDGAAQFALRMRGVAEGVYDGAVVLSEIRG